MGAQQRREFIDFITKQKTASWAATTEGQWDFIITSYIENEKAYLEMINRLFSRFGRYLREKNILRTISATTLNEKYLHPNKKTIIKQENDLLEPEIKKDKTDLEIIKALSANSRSSFTEIAKKVGLTAEGVAYRYKKIMQKELIKSLKIRINHEKLGLSYYHLFLSLNNYQKKEELKKYYVMHPNCVFIMEHLGYYDMHLEFIVPEEEVQKIVEEISEKFGEELSSYELIKIRKEHIINVLR